MSFWGELKRRNVYKVGVAYAIVAWLLIQGAAIIFPHLNLPSWAITLVIVILLIGFPLALLLAWAYEVTPEGIKRTKEVPLHESITHLTGRKLNYILAGLLVLSLAYIVFNKYYFEPQVIETKQASVVSNVAKVQKTIAVLPFENLSSDPEQVYFVDGLSEEILNSLAKISDLNVIARTSSFSFKGSSKTIQEIAGVLGADHILEGSVRKAGNTLRITTQLIRAADGIHIWSETYDRKPEDILAIQEDIATSVANELKVKFGIGTSLKQLGGTDNVEAYKLCLIARGQWFEGSYVAISRALESIDSAIAIDPKFAYAWALKTSIQGTLSNFVPVSRYSKEIDASLQAAQKAIELEPNFAAAYNAIGQIKTIKGDWIGAETSYQKAIELNTQPSSQYQTVSSLYQEVWFMHYFSVFHFEKANDILEEVLQWDPFNQIVREFYIWSFIFSGDMKRAEEEYKRAMALFGDQVLSNYISIILARSGAHELTPHELETIISHIYNPIPEATRSNLKSEENVLAELHRLYTEDNNLSLGNLLYIAEWTAYFGNSGLAMEAMEKLVNISPYNIYNFWNPVFKEVRQLPRFKELVKKIGLVHYWNKFGWPDICRPLDNGDFECD